MYNLSSSFWIYPLRPAQKPSKESHPGSIPTRCPNHINWLLSTRSSFTPILLRMSEPFALSPEPQRKPQREPQLSFHHNSLVQHLHYCWWIVNKFPRYLNSLAWGSFFPPTHKNHGLRLGDSHSSWLSCSKFNIFIWCSYDIHNFLTRLRQLDHSSACWRSHSLEANRTTSLAKKYGWRIRSLLYWGFLVCF